MIRKHFSRTIHMGDDAEMTLMPNKTAHREGTTADQLRAVYAVMKILAEDDRERAPGADQEMLCESCRRDRPAAGSVDYSGTRLCNGCATDYELLRIAGQVPDLAAYLRRS
jgi:hypothetical protein